MADPKYVTMTLTVTVEAGEAGEAERALKDVAEADFMGMFHFESREATKREADSFAEYYKDWLEWISEEEGPGGGPNDEGA